MTAEKLQLFIIQGTIAELSPEDRAEVARIAQVLRDVIYETREGVLYPQGEAVLAMVLVAAELQAKAAE